MRQETLISRPLHAPLLEMSLQPRLERTLGPRACSFPVAGLRAPAVLPSPSRPGCQPLPLPTLDSARSCPSGPVCWEARQAVTRCRGLRLPLAGGLAVPRPSANHQEFYSFSANSHVSGEDLGLR